MDLLISLKNNQKKKDLSKLFNYPKQIIKSKLIGDKSQPLVKNIIKELGPDKI